MKGVIGLPVTIQKLFLDANNAPFNVTTPTIQIYYWDADGVKQTLLMTTSFPASTPSETGRYSYTYDIPTTLTEDVVLYALIQAVNPDTLLPIVEEIQIDLYDPSVTTTCSQLIAQFVRGG